MTDDARLGNSTLKVAKWLILMKNAVFFIFFGVEKTHRFLFNLHIITYGRFIGGRTPCFTLCKSK